jgi:predicted enzyme related to lactoylglutathione lyase
VTTQIKIEYRARTSIRPIFLSKKCVFWGNTCGAKQGFFEQYLEKKWIKNYRCIEGFSTKLLSPLRRLCSTPSTCAKIGNRSYTRTSMQRVTGIGGIFFKARDPVALRAWYQKHLGIDVQDWGGAAFSWGNSGGTTIWNATDGSGDYFAPGTSNFMVNYRVADLHAMLVALRAEGCNVLEKVDDSQFGKFGWVIDPEGSKVELWEPPAGQ